MKYLILACCFVSLLSACSTGGSTNLNEQKLPKVSATDLIGTWRNLSMTITYPDTDSVFEVPEGKWEETLKIKPIVTTYYQDQSFISRYYSLADTLLFTNEGSWELKNDSLLLTVNNITTAYQFTLEGNIGTFTGILDWDEDGKNDVYRGRQVEGSQETARVHQEDIIGKWRSEYLEVNIETYKGSDSTVVLDVTPENYEETIGLQTAVVVYRPDGSYKEDYIGLDGKPKYSQSGYWFLLGDTIVLAIYKPLTRQAVQRYHVQLENHRGTFTSLMDYDGDGAEDDDFRGVSVKMKP